MKPNLFWRAVPSGVGLVLLLAAGHKLWSPAEATGSLEALGLPFRLADALVASVTGVELALGLMLVLGVARRPAAVATMLLLTLFTAYLAWLAMLAQPPACGCLGLGYLFESHRHNALLGMARNCALVWLLKLALDRATPAATPAPTPPPATAAPTHA